MKKITEILVIMFILLPVMTSAGNLVYIEASPENPAEKIIKKFEKPIFYEERFALIHHQSDGNAGNYDYQILSGWDNSKYYFVLYPVREFNIDEIKKYSTILLLQPDYLIIETELEILNDYSEFHAFKIVRIFDKTIKQTLSLPLDLSQEMFINNPVIQQLVDTVSIDSLWSYLSILQSMERYTNNASAINSSNYLKNYFENLGYDTVYFHTWQSGAIPNVVAVKYGMLNPDEIYLVGGHYDTYTNGAPGADDNGSGSASIMEMARVMSPMRFKRTIKYVLFSGEELGLLGSSAYASQAASNNDNIVGMINMDMIAYVQPGDQIDVDVVKNTASQDLYDAYLLATQTYVPNLPVVIGSLPFGASSDHASFWNNGFRAIFPFEDSDNYSPYIHTSQDVIGTSANNQVLAEFGTKSVVGALATLAEIADSRISGSVYSASSLEPIENAKIIFNGDSVFTNANGSFMTPALSVDNYQIIISATGFESDTVEHYLNEFEVFNLDINLIPAGMVRPYIHISEIIIDDDSTGNSLGNNNAIADAGEIIEVTFNFLNSGNLNAEDISGTIQTSNQWLTILQDSVFADSIAVDSFRISNNKVVIEIDPETPANTNGLFTVDLSYQGFNNSTSFTLNVHNRGDILIIEDDDNDGGLAAYTTALDCLHITYDVATSAILQQEMAEYDFMIWFCGDDYSATLTTDDQIKLAGFLDNGGKLFINGVDIGYDINTNPFYTNYLKANYLADGPYSATTMVYGTAANPISGDFSSGLNMNDNYVDQISPAGGAAQIFYYDHNGSNVGCGVTYDGIYQLVYLTFSFENIQNINHQRTLLNNIWTWFGGNALTIDDQNKTVYSYRLNQNYPNPFNPVTTIEFSISKTEKVQLEIYNVLGQKVATLFDNDLNAGVHKVLWNATDFASGVYFYKLKSGSFEKTRKLILLK